VAIDRAKAYCIVRDLLPPGPVSVIDFGCRDGRGRNYLGETVRYLGLERSRVKAWPGVDVRGGFDYSERIDMPTGFDAAICLSLPLWANPGTVVWRLGQAVKAGGQVFVGVKFPGDIERVKRFFRTAKVWRAAGVTMVEGQGLKTAKEIAA
jgi:hypothetical protein